MVKGYEFAKDQYVMFTPEELKALEEAGTQTADITEFVPISAVDPVYFDKAYYLAPDKGGAKPYALFAKALRESKRCALGRWAARGKQYIVMIRPVDDGLVMQQLLYAGEVRSINEIEIPEDRRASDAELKLAKQLIEQQTSATRSIRAQYTDEVSDAHRSRRSQQKVEGQEITMAEAPEGGGAQVIDLMEALRASLEKKGVQAGRRRRAEAAATGPQARQARAVGREPQRRRAAAKSKPRNSAQAMHPYGVRDVERLLGLPRSTIRALVGAGFVTPERGPRNAWLFSFQDLIVLRTAQALVGVAGAAAAHHALAEGAAPPPARRDAAVGPAHRAPSAIASWCSEGGKRWQAESGQYLLAFEGDPGGGLAQRHRADARARGAAPCAPNTRPTRDAALEAATTTAPRSRPTTEPIVDDPSRVDARIESRPPAARDRPSRRSRAGLSRRARTCAATTRCCSTTSACCSTTWIARSKRWLRTSSRCAAIRRWPIATTTSRCSTKSSSNRRMRSGTWRSTGGSSRASHRAERLPCPLFRARENGKYIQRTDVAASDGRSASRVRSNVPPMIAASAANIAPTKNATR